MDDGQAHGLCFSVKPGGGSATIIGKYLSGAA